MFVMCFCFQAVDGIRGCVASRGVGDMYKRKVGGCVLNVLRSRVCVCVWVCMLNVLGSRARACVRVCVCVRAC